MAITLIIKMTVQTLFIHCLNYDSGDLFD